MEYITTSAEMQKIDYQTINEIGIPGMVLMEKAALKMHDLIVDRFDQTYRFCVVCGCGNNGGDGVVLARMLVEDGYDVTVQVVGNLDHSSEQFATQISIITNLDISYTTEEVDYNSYDVLVDAIFGVGLTRDVKGHYAEIIDTMDVSNTYKIAVDAPSGICCTTGNVLGTALHCDWTITFGLMKKGLLLYPGNDYAGEVTVSNIGFPQKVIETYEPGAFTYTENDLYRLPSRRNDSNKGTYGKVLIVAGTKNMAGACYFSAKASYLMGAGLVQILTREENRVILQGLIPEAVMTTYKNKKEAISLLRNAAPHCKAVVIGPGLGVNKVTDALLEEVLNNYEGNLIIDADACNMLNRHLEALKNCFANIIITPHMKEASRILGCTIADLKARGEELAGAFADEYELTFVLKDARTIIRSPKELTYINSSGNNGMSTGGSGDVLTGIIAGLCSGGLDYEEAARLGVYIHGRSGDFAAKAKGTYSLMANDLLENLPNALKIDE